MLCLPFLASSARQRAATSPLLLANPQAQPGAGAVVASGDWFAGGVRSVIHTLHKLQYAEQATWSQVITIPESGILITPEQGEVFSLLRRDCQGLLLD
jgi:hypothetical protein